MLYFFIIYLQHAPLYMLCYIYYVILYHIILCYLILYYIMLSYLILYYVILYYILYKCTARCFNHYTAIFGPSKYVKVKHYNCMHHFKGQIDPS